MVLNLGSNSLRDIRTVTILKELAKNPRISIRHLALKLGMNYLSVRRKVSSLMKRNKISFGLLVSADIIGREVALVHIKTDNPDHLNSILVNCARVILAVKTGNDEILAVIRGRSKQEVPYIIESLRTCLGSEIKEFSISYGTLYQDALVIFKNNHSIENNGELDCNPEYMCINCMRMM